jgi:hypothetical protein
MPSNVARFEQLMYLSLGIGVIASTLSWSWNVAQAAAMGGASFVLFVQVFVLAFMVLMIWLTARRRKNWARWLLLILALLGLPAYVHIFGRMMSAGFLAGLLSSVQFVVQAIAFVLLFTGNAPDWFKVIREPASA